MKLMTLFIIMSLVVQCSPYYTARQNTGLNWASSVVVYNPNGTVVYTATNVTYRYQNGDLVIGTHMFPDEWYTWNIDREGQ